jgi:hypothetical protein
MNKLISHSAWNKYQTCPRMYKLHYIEKLRPTGKTSALLFGTAVDEGLNSLLLKSGDPVKTFQENFTWEMCQDIKWFDSDYDPDLLTEEQTESLTGKTKEYVTWACMRVKGRMLIEQYIEQILPLIEEVHHVQLETSRPGQIDAVLSIRGHGMVLVDHKTSARYYKRDSVKSSSQLALYARQVGISKAGFCVLSKNINKNKIKTCKKCGHKTSSAHKTCNNVIDGSRCHGEFDVTVNPQANIQLIIDDLDAIEMDLVEKSVQQTEKAIKNKVFPMNLNACHNFYGRKCPYFNYCRKKDMAGLDKKKD